MRDKADIRIETARGTAVFTVNQLPGMQSGKLLMRIGRTFGPGLATILGKLRPADLAKGTDALGDMEVDLPRVVRETFAELNETEFDHLVDQLLGDASVKVGGEVHSAIDLLDTLFQGHVEGLFRLLWHALAVNYGNFLGALAKMVGTAGAKAKLPKTSS